MSNRRLLSATLTLSVLSIVACSDGPIEPPSSATDPAADEQTDMISANQSQLAGDRFVVVFEDGVDPGPAAQRIAAGVGGDVLHVYEEALRGFALSAPGVGIQQIAEAPGVAYVEPDQVFQTFSQTLPTGIDRIQADQNTTAAIDGSATGVDGDIAIIDSGIDLDHPDLNVHASTDCTGGGPFNASCTDGEGDDGNGHGTHVAGTAAAIDDDQGVVGMAPGARLWAVKVLDDNGSGWMSDIIAGVDWVTGHASEVEVANMSLGASGTWSTSLRDAIATSVQAGVVYVVAAGNDDADIYGGDGSIGDGNEIIPAAYPEVAAISALADSDGQPGGNGDDTSYGSDDSFASFSNYSEAVVGDNPVSSPGAAIDLLLPGVDILSTWNDGGTYTASGTSMASPHGAGLALLHILANNLSPANADDVVAVRQALIDGGVKQDSADGLATLDDSDSNWEHIGWAESSGAPSVSWVNPSDGEQISGSITIQIDASDSEDGVGTLTVEWRVDGGTWQSATYNSTSGYYEDSWDTSPHSDGDHTLDTQATDSDTNTATSTITVTTENTDDPPTVTITNPNDGETVSGTVTVTADASDDESVAEVEFFVDGNSIGTDSNDSDGWSIDWNTENYADKDHTVTAEATDNNSQTASDQISVTVNNSSTTSDMYVSDIGFRTTGPHLRSTVTVRQDSDGDGTAESSNDPVADATVSFTLRHDTDGDGIFECGGDDDCRSFSGTTDSSGQIEFTWQHAPSGKYEAEVTGLTHDSLTWDSSLDADNPDYFTF